MADVVLCNARVVTPTPERPASTVVVRDGRIAAVGGDDVASGARAGARRIDLAGRTLVPGFIDAHAHIWKIGHLLTTMLDLRGVDSVESIVARVAACRAGRPAGSWILGRGYNEATMAEGRAPTRHDLDRAAPDQPVVLTRTCGHIYAVELGGAGRRRHHRRHRSPGRRRDRPRPRRRPHRTAARDGDGPGDPGDAAAVGRRLRADDRGGAAPPAIARHHVVLRLRRRASAARRLSGGRRRRPPAGPRQRHAAAPRRRGADAGAAPRTAPLGLPAGRHGEVPRRRRTERRHRRAQRALSPRRHTRDAALRPRRPAGAVPREPRCRLAHRHPRDRRRRHRPGARHLRVARTASARPGPSPRALRPARCAAAGAGGQARRHRRAADDLHPQPGPQLPRLPARRVPAALLSDPRHARRRHPGGAVLRRPGGRGRQPADGDAGGDHPP